MSPQPAQHPRGWLQVLLLALHAPPGLLRSPDTRLPIVKQINSAPRRGIAVLSGRLGSGREESSCSGAHSSFLFGFSSV